MSEDQNTSHSGLGISKAFPDNAILNMTALELSQTIRSRDVSCVEVMQTTLEQIELHNPAHNAIVSMPHPEELLSQAKVCDSELSRGAYRGWMHGFPHAVKDLADVQGLLTTQGSTIFAENVATADSSHIKQIRDAGAIFIGKTNVPEFGLGSHSYNAVFGTTLNAYDNSCSAGGSSGGAAAALALRMVPVADGSDLMGSLRNPAGFNNVIGFRPTPGLVPLQDSFMEQLPCNGPMARTVPDTAMLLSTMAAAGSELRTSRHSHPAAFTCDLGRDFKGCRIGWLGDYDGYLAMDAAMIPLCEKALQGFSDLGCQVEDASIDFSMERLWQTWLTLRHWLVRGIAAPLYDNPTARAQLKPEFIWEIEGGRELTAEDILGASRARASWYRAVLKAFNKYDFLVLPTAQVFPFESGEHWPKTINGRAMDTYHRWMEVVVGGTLSGCPVINVPAGFSVSGLPAGLQIMAPRFADLSALQIGHAYEQATRWNLDFSPSVLTH